MWQEWRGLVICQWRPITSKLSEHATLVSTMAPRLSQIAGMERGGGIPPGVTAMAPKGLPFHLRP